MRNLLQLRSSPKKQCSSISGNDLNQNSTASEKWRIVQCCFVVVVIVVVVFKVFVAVAVVVVV